MIAIEMSRGQATPQHVVRKIRKELDQGYGVCVVAKWNDVDESTVSRIKNGQRHAEDRPCRITLLELGIRPADEPCTGCGHNAPFTTILNVCVNCHLRELEKQGRADFGIQ